MTQDINNTQDLNKIDIVANSRSKLIYDYTEKLYKAKSDNIDVLNTRMGLLLGASATLLKFVFDLKTKDLCINHLACYSCIALQLLSVCCIVGSLYSCLQGLNSNAIGRTVLPSVLMEDEHYESSEESTRAFIVNTWIPTIREFEEAAERKSSLIKKALVSLAVALLFFGIDSLVVIFYGQK